MGRLDGKVALISGGAKGQGAVEGRMFAREGAAVVLGDILDDDGKKVEAEIRASGGRATYVHLNVTRETDWRGGGGPGPPTTSKTHRPGDQNAPLLPSPTRGQSAGPGGRRQ